MKLSPSLLLLCVLTCAGGLTACTNDDSWSLERTSGSITAPDQGLGEEQPEPTPVSCREGYTLVAANADLGTARFCVARFEMKESAGHHVSQAEGTPASATYAEAESACASEGARLPTNNEWNAIALEIKNQSGNWHAGELQTGLHALWDSPRAIANISDPYDQVPGGAPSAKQKRRFELASGEYLWDFGGNAWEWVATEIFGANYQPSFADSWGHRPNEAYWFPNLSRQLTDFFPTLNPHVMGLHYGVVFGGNTGRVLRGGGVYMFNAQEVGIFSAALDAQASDRAAPRNYNLSSNLRNIGFRCVRAEE